MKIMYFTDTYLPKIDGIAISISQFTELLAKKGHEFFICCPSYGSDDYYPDTARIHIHRFPATGLPSYDEVKMVLPTPRTIADINKHFKPELFHIHTPGFLGMAGIEYGRQTGVPVVATYHTLVDQQHEYMSFLKMLRVDGLVEEIKSGSPLTVKLIDRFTLKKWRDALTTKAKKKFIRTIVNTVYERSDVIISPSNLIKKELKSYGVKTKVKVVSNGMDLEAFNGEAKNYPAEIKDGKTSKSDYPWKLLHVGRISYEKNCDILLRAFAEFRKKFPNSTFTIVGDGPAVPGLKKLAATLKLEKAVDFTGFVAHEQLPTIYPKYDVFWTASTMETQGLVVLEAMACGLPAIGVDAFALPELIHHGRNGYLARPFAINELVDNLTQLFSNAENYDLFSKNSLEIAGTHELNQCADNLEDLYFDTLAKYKKKSKK